MTLQKPRGFRDVRPCRLVRLSNLVPPFLSHLPIDMASRTKTHDVYRLLVNVNENSSHRLNPDFTVTGREVHDKPWTVIPIQSIAWSFSFYFYFCPFDMLPFSMSSETMNDILWAPLEDDQFASSFRTAQKLIKPHVRGRILKHSSLACGHVRDRLYLLHPGYIKRDK
jgi:hypothetical protein